MLRHIKAANLAGTSLNLLVSDIMDHPLNLSEGPIRHPVLPDGMISRIRAYKDALGDVEPESLEKVIDGFKRDERPEEQLDIWERIASTFVVFLTFNPTDNLRIRKEVFAVILGTSLGTRDWSHIKLLSKDQIGHIALSYTGV